jgi:hypothetical protein
VAPPAAETGATIENSAPRTARQTAKPLPTTTELGCCYYEWDEFVDVLPILALAALPVDQSHPIGTALDSD